MTRAPLRRCVAAAAIGAAAGLAVGARHGIPYVARFQEWSLAVYEGRAPLELRPARGARTPALTARDVTDVPAVFLADPFMARQGSRWFMFFELMRADTARGVIGVASSGDAIEWSYEQVVLSEPFHLSYPHVFQDHDGTWYMSPETTESGEVRLYRARSFPWRWEPWATLLTVPRSDPSIFWDGGRWWMFVGHGAECLELYWAEALAGPWQAHAANPVVAGDPQRARPGGRVIRVDDELIRFGQDGRLRYGAGLGAYRITTLTPQTYAEEPASPHPVLGAGDGGWNALGMHHGDLHADEDRGWIACVDGQRFATALRAPWGGRAWRGPHEPDARALSAYFKALWG